MGKRRCKETSLNSFFGTFLYEQKVAKDHFLRKLNEIIEWDRFTDKLLGYYKGKGGIGRDSKNAVEYSITARPVSFCNSPK